MAKTALMAVGCGGRVRDRQRLGWMDGVKMDLGSTWMTVEAARQCEKIGMNGKPGCICR